MPTHHFIDCLGASSDAERGKAPGRDGGEVDAVKGQLDETSERELELRRANERGVQEAEQLRGEGDGQRNQIYAAAYGKDPEFFAFFRSMLAYENSIKDGTPIVLSPDSDFFQYFRDKDGKK